MVMDCRELEEAFGTSVTVCWMHGEADGISMKESWESWMRG